jgi:HEAT repeat protein
MERPSLLRRLKIFAGLMAGALLLLSGVAWLQRAPLLAWYTIHRLLHAPESTRQAWVGRVAELDQTAVPQLIAGLRHADVQVCSAAQQGLLTIAHRWEPSDSRYSHLAGCLVARFTSLSEPGQQVALEIQADLLTRAGTPTPELLSAAGRILAEAARTTDTGVHQRALALALRLTNPRAAPELLAACRELARSCLSDQATENRLQAIVLAVRPEMDLLEAVAPLLSDPVPEVRQKAMLAVGSAPAAINTDDLLRWLHDPDPGVRRLCEQALCSRGLGDEHLKLGRLLTDSRPGVRLQVLDELCRANDLEPGVWLRYLSHDAAPAVRAAAVRAAAERSVTSLTDRIEQMAQNDPCPSVRQLAQYYLSSQKPRPINSAER